jgi:hypothetical protein
VLCFAFDAGWLPFPEMRCLQSGLVRGLRCSVPSNPVAVDVAALELIGRTPRVLRSLLLGLPPSLLERPNDEGWSLKDIVAHLVDVEGIAFTERMGRMLHSERPFIESIDPPSRMTSGGYVARTLEDLLDDLERQRSAHTVWLASLGPAELTRTGEHDTVGEISVVDIAHQWAAHDMAHLRQITLMIQQYLAPMMGRTRGFYDV